MRHKEYWRSSLMFAVALTMASVTSCGDEKGKGMGFSIPDTAIPIETEGDTEEYPKEVDDTEEFTEDIAEDSTEESTEESTEPTESADVSEPTESSTEGSSDNTETTEHLSITGLPNSLVDEVASKAIEGLDSLSGDLETAISLTDLGIYYYVTGTDFDVRDDDTALSKLKSEQDLSDIMHNFADYKIGAVMTVSRVSDTERYRELLKNNKLANIDTLRAVFNIGDIYMVSCILTNKQTNESLDGILFVFDMGDSYKLDLYYSAAKTFK